MSRKIMVGLVVLALILAAGMGIYYLVNFQFQAVDANELKEPSSSPFINLVYVGTNETLSEALYNLDKQDGKLDKSHIVHKFINDNKHILRFIDKGNKLRKELRLEDANSKIDVYITQNGRYAMVQSDFNERDFSRTTQYYDINGNLIWEKKNSPTYYYVSPNGELILEVPGWDYQVIHLARQYALLNPKGKVIKEFEVKMDGVNFGEPLIEFSNNNKYLLMAFNIDYVGGGKNRIILFDEKGDKLLDKEINGVNVNIYSTRPLNNGNLLLDTIKEEPERLKITKILGKDGSEIYSRTEKAPSNVSISPDNKILGFHAHGAISCVYLPDFEEKSIDTSEILLEDGESLFLEAVTDAGAIIAESHCNSKENPKEAFYIIASSKAKEFYMRRKRPYLGSLMREKYFILILDSRSPVSYNKREMFIFKLE